MYACMPLAESAAASKNIGSILSNHSLTSSRKAPSAWQRRYSEASVRRLAIVGATRNAR
jgi:hypothetical protein